MSQAHINTNQHWYKVFIQNIRTSPITLSNTDLESCLDFSQMGMIRLPSLLQNAKQILKKQQQQSSDLVPKGHVAVYVGEAQWKRYVVPISYLNHPLFLDLLHSVEEEFGFNHPMGGLTIPCKEDMFIDITSQLKDNN